ncbi:hypothetical protein G647_01389 [Cladophialophora carrionii CBS 160.54]|uniref:N-acetyltransferase domain-containing protein n=1 Tax=Cladophialophora carrionii CBS 160.54 TaxID=1279043 RepID=V9DSL0_9EURO|nr:uncharacterized protein G647_01389 [Cladophialophora carrionii CBS 160.54]ETI28937.1 hypothetical protein G647_01389 [Cladophialophora carrionii CBS 160.54]
MEEVPVGTGTNAGTDTATDADTSVASCSITDDHDHGHGHGHGHGHDHGHTLAPALSTEVRIPHLSPPTSSTTTSISFTLSRSPEYAHRLAEITSRATLTDPLNVVFQQETAGASTPVTSQLLYIGAKRRVDAKLAAGAVVVEAGNFAAVACWEPPAAIATAAQLTQEQEQEQDRQRPIFARFLRQVQDAETACFGSDPQPRWKLSLMARDPLRRDKGAVRAVIEPFVTRAKAERVPLWLVAGNERARDVYAYFGFRVVDVVWSYPGGTDEGVSAAGRDGVDGGIPTWCMVCNWPVE